MIFSRSTEHCLRIAIDDEMYDIIHQMRTRIVTSPSFTGERILGAILFEMTMDREVEGQGTADYLWQIKNVVPFLKVVNDTAVAVNQGGKRKGAVCAYLESWHLDIEEFIELRKNTGDDRRRTHDMNTANWIPDLFMERVEKDWQWSLFDPKKVPPLVDLYGQEFEDASLAAESEGLYFTFDGQSFETGQAVKASGQARAGWKILRRLGAELELDGFSQVDITSLRDEMLAEISKTDFSAGEVELAAPTSAGDLHRVGDVLDRAAGEAFVGFLDGLQIGAEFGDGVT